MPERVMLFVDAQNAYKGARDAFFPPDTPHTDGQFDPLAIGRLICDRPPPGFDRSLEGVRVYTGRPDSTRDPRAYSAHMRQCAQWERDGAVVVARSLQYPQDWPRLRAREKGIDVQLAIDYVTGAVDGWFDVGIIFSSDTDLRPALEFVVARYAGRIRTEVVAWEGSKRLSTGALAKMWCHWLRFADYAAVNDPTDYNR